MPDPEELNTETAADLPAPAPSESIVVGHDDSRGSNDSLEVALELAEKLVAPLVVVRSWSIDTAPRNALFHGGEVASLAEVTALVRENLIRETAPLVQKHPSVTVHYQAVLGQSAETLMLLSANARMLVVGSRGRGGFASLMLGSVSEQCVRHATCPVLVVRPRAATHR